MKFALKGPIYKGAPAHAGEYEGETVENEAERIKQQIIQINEDLKKKIDCKIL